MAAFTKEFFPLREESRLQVAQWFHALSDDTRLQILDCLSQGEECVCDLTTLLETGQSRLSFHLKILKDAGIVTDPAHISAGPGADLRVRRFPTVSKQL
jgi:DNA-binding transcriptional ArsR family regulator